MKYLITGSCGFIGSALTKRLLQNGHYVIGVDNMSKRAINLRNLDSLYDLNHKMGETSRFTFIEFDLKDFSLYCEKLNTDLMKSVDVIIHLASLAGVRSSIERPVDYINTNITATYTFYQYASQFKNIQHFVFASSSSVYGENSKIPFSEEDDIQKQISPYAASKAASEHFIYSGVNTYRLPATGLRFFTVYGPNGRRDMAALKFIRNISYDEPIPVFGDLSKNKRDYTYIDDIIDGIIKSIERGNLIAYPFRVYNLCGAYVVPLNVFINAIEYSVNKTSIQDRLCCQKGDVEITNGCLKRSKLELDYQVKVTTFVKE